MYWGTRKRRRNKGGGRESRGGKVELQEWWKQLNIRRVTADSSHALSMCGVLYMLQATIWINRDHLEDNQTNTYINSVSVH